MRPLEKAQSTCLTKSSDVPLPPPTHRSEILKYPILEEFEGEKKATLYDRVKSTVALNKAAPLKESVAQVKQAYQQQQARPQTTKAPKSNALYDRAKSLQKAKTPISNRSQQPLLP